MTWAHYTSNTHCPRSHHERHGGLPGGVEQSVCAAAEAALDLMVTQWGVKEAVTKASF